MSERRARERAGIAAIGLVAGVAIATILAVGLGGPAPSPRTSASSTPVGPVVFYEVLDADGSLLLARSLDGSSLARVVSRRPSIDYGRTWSVDPAGKVAIGRFDDSDGPRLEAVDVVTGASRWIVDAPAVDLDLAVWSADGSRFAATVDGEDESKRQAVIVDVASGTVSQVPIPPDPIPQGFDDDGGLVLRQRLLDAQGQGLGWRFLRIDPATRAIEQMPIPPALGPHTSGSDDVDPETGIGLDSAPREDGAGTDLRAWSLAGGKPRMVANFESVDAIAIDPSGRLVAIGISQSSVVLATLDGQSSPVWAGQGRGDIVWSAGGDYLGVSSWDRVSRIDIVERTTGRVVALPMPAGIAEGRLVRIVGGTALPDVALPAVEPTPTPTPGPSGPDLAAGGAVVAGWIDEANQHSIVHAERLIPTQQGGLRSTVTMDPVDLGVVQGLGADGDPRESAPRLTLLPQPHSPDVLVWVDSPAGNRAWLWSPGGIRRDLPLPTGWPTISSDVSWRPDGLAIAAAAYETDLDGTTHASFVIGTLDGEMQRLDVPPEYDRLEGWWSQTELLLGHGICTEGCPGRYSWSARFTIADRKLHQFNATDHGHLPIHTWYVDDTGRTIVLSAVNEDEANDIRIDWPASMPIAGALDVIGWSPDGGDLLVSARTAAGSKVFRIDDPVGRARAGDLADPAPVQVGSLPNAGAVTLVSPDGKWAMTSDRTGAAQLVELATGRAWPVDPVATVVWQAGE
jgi:hypothetical protein